RVSQCFCWSNPLLSHLSTLSTLFPLTVRLKRRPWLSAGHPRGRTRSTRGIKVLTALGLLTRPEKHTVTSANTTARDEHSEVLSSNSEVLTSNSEVLTSVSLPCWEPLPDQLPNGSCRRQVTG